MTQSKILLYFSLLLQLYLPEDLDRELENQDDQGSVPEETHSSSGSEATDETEVLRLRGGAVDSQLSVISEAEDVWPHSLSEPHILDMEVRLSSSTSVKFFSEFRVSHCYT